MVITESKKSQFRQISDICSLPSPMTPPYCNDCQAQTESKAPLSPCDCPMTKKRKKTSRSQPASQPGKPARDSVARPECEEMQGNARVIETSGLSPRQQAALPVISASPTIAQAARDVGVHESTIYRWLEDESFRKELARLREASIQLANEEFQSLRVLAAQVFREAMNHENMAYRMSAARYVTNTGIRLEDMEKLRQDLRQLQDALAGSET